MHKSSQRSFAASVSDFKWGRGWGRVSRSNPVIAARPTARYDAEWGKSFQSPKSFWGACIGASDWKRQTGTMSYFAGSTNAP